MKLIGKIKIIERQKNKILSIKSISWYHGDKRIDQWNLENFDRANKKTEQQAGRNV